MELKLAAIDIIAAPKARSLAGVLSPTRDLAHTANRLLDAPGARAIVEAAVSRMLAEEQLQAVRIRLEALRLAKPARTKTQRDQQRRQRSQAAQQWYSAYDAATRLAERLDALIEAARRDATEAEQRALAARRRQLCIAARIN